MPKADMSIAKTVLSSSVQLKKARSRADKSQQTSAECECEVLHYSSYGRMGFEWGLSINLIWGQGRVRSISPQPKYIAMHNCAVRLVWFGFFFLLVVFVFLSANWSILIISLCPKWTVFRNDADK